MSPRVSIIVSVFKSERFIEHFLHDVARQTIFPQCQVLLLNAASPENEDYYIRGFASCYPDNVLYKKLETQFSVYETWNIGVALAAAPLLTNWNTDDRRAFNSLELQADEFDKDPNLEVCFGPTLTTHIANESFEFCKSKEGFGCYDVDASSLLVNNSPHCFPMWRASIHEKIGVFDTKYKVAADYELWLRALFNRCNFKRIPNFVGSYYRNPTGVSSNPNTIVEALAEIREIQTTYRERFSKNE